ncbi:MAG: hypothetical protein F4053_02210, partial [Proteobacteria bacterium]|nr:hypothetical protein [Pseudomonadota bacterium]
MRVDSGVRLLPERPLPQASLLQLLDCLLPTAASVYSQRGQPVPRGHNTTAIWEAGIMFRLGAFKKAELTLGLLPIGALVLLSIVQSYIYSYVDTSECDLENFAADAAAAWEGYTLLAHTACYERLFKNEGNGDFARRYQQEFESLIADRHPRTGYKIGIHEPREQKMFGLDGPVFGVFYGENTWHPSGTILDVRGENLGFEPDFLLRIGDERANEATTIEEMANYIDRVYAFIELPAHLANPDEIHGAFLPNFYMMQALNLSARYGIIGD